MQMHIFLAPATLLRLHLESLPLHTPNNQVQSILHCVDKQLLHKTTILCFLFHHNTKYKETNVQCANRITSCQLQLTNISQKTVILRLQITTKGKKKLGNHHLTCVHGIYFEPSSSQLGIRRDGNLNPVLGSITNSPRFTLGGTLSDDRSNESIMPATCANISDSLSTEAI